MSTQAKPLQSPQNHWVVILICGCLVCMLSFGMRSTMGFFIVPLSDMNGWNREVFAFSIALQNLFWGLSAPIWGGLVHRLSSRVVIVIGALCYALGLILATFTTSVWGMHFLIGFLVGIGIGATSFGIVLPVMVQYVSEHQRPLVLGIGTSSGSLGQFVIALSAQQLIENYGALSAMFDMGLLVLIMIVLCFVLKDKKLPKPNPQNREVSSWVILKRALSTPSYWYILIGFYVCGFHLAFITAHMPAFLQDIGLPEKLGGISIAIIGFCNIFGAYIAGWLSQRFPNKLILFSIYFLRCFTILMIMLLPITETLVIVFSIFTGFLWLATIPPTTNLVSILFGVKHMAMLYGLVFLNHQLGSFTAVWLGGYLFDTQGSYDLIWQVALLLAFISAIIHLPVKERFIKTGKCKCKLNQVLELGEA